MTDSPLLMLFIAICWVLAAGVTAKLDAALTGDKTEKLYFTLSLFTWPIFAVLLITTKHKVDNAGKNEWGY